MSMMSLVHDIYSWRTQCYYCLVWRLTCRYWSLGDSSGYDSVPSKFLPLSENTPSTRKEGKEITLLNTDMQSNDWHSIQSCSKPVIFCNNPVLFHWSHRQTFFSVWGVLREKYPSRSTNWAALRPYAGNSGQMAQVNSNSISCWDLLEFLKRDGQANDAALTLNNYLKAPTLK